MPQGMQGTRHRMPHLDVGHHSHDRHPVAGEEEEDDEHEEDVPEEFRCAAQHRDSDIPQVQDSSAALSGASHGAT